MRKFLATLLFIVLPGTLLAPAQRAVFFAQNVRATSTSAVAYVSSCPSVSEPTSNTETCQIDNVPAGGLILIRQQNDNPSTTFTVSDSTGNTPVLVLGPNVWDANNEAASMWKIVNAAAGTHVITVTLNVDTHFPSLSVDSFSSGATVDVASNLFSTGATGTSFSCGSVTTSAPGEFVVSYADSAAGVGIHPGSTPQVMTSVAATTGSSRATGHFTGAGANFVSWTLDSPIAWNCDTVVIH